jgi:hypothetical protein
VYEQPVGRARTLRQKVTGMRSAHGAFTALTSSDLGGYHRGMPLLNVVITLIVVGVVLWLINAYIPMQATIKKILNIVVVVVVVLWLLHGFGVIGNSGAIRLPS